MRGKCAVAMGLMLAAGLAHGYSVGQTVADFTLPLAGGGNLTLSHYDGWVVHLYFWSTG